MEAVRAHWSELSRREQKLLMMRFYGNMTQTPIGDQLGISPMHVSRLLTRALDFLRSASPTRAAPRPRGAAAVPGIGAGAIALIEPAPPGKWPAQAAGF